MYFWGMRYLYWDIFLVSNFKNLVQNTICAIYGVFFLVNMVIPCPYEGRNYVFVLIVICHFKIGFSQSHLTWFVVMLKIKLQIWNWKKNCVLLTVSRSLAKELLLWYIFTNYKSRNSKELLTDWLFYENWWLH